jgi:chromate reductase
MKNLLDWTVGGTEMVDRPVAWLNIATDPRRGHGAVDTLRMVLGYVQATIVEDACRHVPVSSDAVGPDGLIDDLGMRAALTDVLTVLAAQPNVRPSPR